MGRIEEAFARLRERGEKGLIPFITAGDPSLAVTGELIPALADAGADLVELGIPFSDPMADGPVIQAASERALAGGTTLRGVLEMVARVRRRTQVPIVLMGYYNPVLCFGPERFAREAAAAGVDGILLVDLPPEEAGEIREYLTEAGIRYITLLAPTTPSDRRARLAAEGEGYLYYVSMTGVTGVQRIDVTAIETEVAALRGASPVPVAVGFGISSPEDAAAVAGFADAVVVGSALVKTIAACGASDPVPQAAAFVRSLKEGIARTTR